MILCAGCGKRLDNDLPSSDDASLCAACEEQIQQADTAWIKKEEGSDVKN